MARVRAILHVDMDAFYASVEQRDNPELAGLPVIVGGTSGRGVVAAASYEVRRFGVRSAMPMRTALELCPQAVCVRPRMQRYAEASEQVFGIFRAVTPLVQGLSLDEAFLDVTGSLGLGVERAAATGAGAEAAAGAVADAAAGAVAEAEQARRAAALFPAARAIAVEIKARIRAATGLTASVGVAPNKLVAKIASDLAKPDGLTVVTPERINEVLDPLSVRRLPGLGRKTGARVEASGVRTLGELRRAPDRVLRPIFGRYTESVRERAAGVDERPVEADRIDKSISAEDTFERDIADATVLCGELARLADLACSRLRGRSLAAGCIAVKIRRHDFSTFTRQRAVAPPTQDRRTVARIARGLLERWLKDHPGAKLRLLGVALSELGPMTQLGLFQGSRGELDATLDEIHERFGMQAVRRASSIK